MPLAFLTIGPFAWTLALLALPWVGAKAGGEGAVRLKLSAVAGNLGLGAMLATFVKVIPGFPGLTRSTEAGVLASLGSLYFFWLIMLEGGLT
ncbi:hypothetical protein [Geothrix fuzhouensis]|uniref:hypothetical protein n=1 Tax=Geothrix fuzhouensis TaxID=2966451 RepID=UPI0021480B1A|nr:hypothetical protein [Geothrix fuzhouensis]